MSNRSITARILQLFIALILAFAPVTVASASSYPVQPVPARQALALNDPNWWDVQIQDGMIYALFKYPYEIRRYDTAGKIWLAPIPLSSAATAFLVVPDGFYVAYNYVVMHVGPAGENPVTIYTSPIKDYNNTPLPIVNILAADGFLFIGVSSYSIPDTPGSLISVDPVTGQAINTVNQPVKAIAAAPGANKLYAGSMYQSPSYMVQISYTANGMLDSSWVTDPSGKSTSPGSRTVVSPDETRVINSGGVVYAADLNPLDTLTGMLTDLVMVGSTLVGLRNDQVISFDGQWIETGLYQPSAAPLRLLSEGQTVYAISDNDTYLYSDHNPIVETIPLASIQPPVPGEPVNPVGLSYNPGKMVIDKNEIVYILSKENRSIFRYSPAERRYLTSIPLARGADLIAYDAARHQLYLGYQNRRITRIDLAVSFAEIPVMVLGNSPYSFTVGDTFLMVISSPAPAESYAFGSTTTYTSYTLSGQKLSTTAIYYGVADELFWDSVPRRVFALPRGNGAVLYMQINPDGTFTGNASPPYPDNYSYSWPMRRSPDGLTYTMGGAVADVTSLLKIYTFPAYYTDLIWWKGVLYAAGYTYSYPVGSSYVQKLNADYSSAAMAPLSGQVRQMFAVQDGLLAVTYDGERPHFTLFDETLAPLTESPVAGFEAAPISGVTPLAVQFTNTTTGPGETTYLWDFGDGSTSTETNPTHIYTHGGHYSVRLTATGPGGVDGVYKPGLVTATQRTWLPMVVNGMLNPSEYNYENACDSFMIYSGTFQANMTECVPQIAVYSTTSVMVFFTWQADIIVNPEYGCLEKHDDYLNPNMYLTDQAGNRYDMTSAGGAARGVYCMQSGYPYTGYFVFPPSQVPDPVYTFHDDDNWIDLGPLPAFGK
jgi:PKD repeat protein